MTERLTRQTLRGVWHALLTPWTDNDELDETRYRQEIRSYANTGMDGLYTGGTTGEFYAQDDATFARITAITCEEAHALGFPVQIGCTALSTRVVRQRVRVALRCHADAIQLALPFWLELRPVEAIDFLADIAQTAGDVPLVLYQTGRAKRKLTPSELAQAAQRVPTLIGTKDTGCDLDTLKAMTTQTDLAIFGGDNDFVERLPLGGRGGYCSVTGLNPRYIVTYYQHVVAGRLDQAKQMQAPIAKLLHEYLIPLIKSEGLMDSALDRMMRVLGGGQVGLRCQKPHVSASAEEFARMRQWCQQHTPTLLPAS